MTHYTELKRLAEGAVHAGDHWGRRDSFERQLAKLVSPEVVLALIAESESARKHWQNESNNVQVLVAEVARLKAESEALRKDAGRWRAFINCARIKFFGWAGYSEKDPYGNSPGDYRHFGGEFWTIHDAPTADKAKAAEILNGFADAAVAALGKGEQS